MDDLISRQAAIDAVRAFYDEYVVYDNGRSIEEILSELPSAQPDRKKGKWIEEPNCWYRCSKCGKHYPSIRGYMDYNFCPNCGAEMRGETDE